MDNLAWIRETRLLKRTELCIERNSEQEGGGNRSWMDWEGALWLDRKMQKNLWQNFWKCLNPHISYHQWDCQIFSPWKQKVKVLWIDTCCPLLAPINWQLMKRAEMGESEKSANSFQFLLLDTHVWDPNFDIDFVFISFFILVLKFYDSTVLYSIPWVWSSCKAKYNSNIVLKCSEMDSCRLLPVYKNFNLRKFNENSTLCGAQWSVWLLPNNLTSNQHHQTSGPRGEYQNKRTDNISSVLWMAKASSIM